MMDARIEKIVEKVVQLFHDLHHVDKPIYTLLQESGYFESYNQVEESTIIESLKKQPNCINEWLQYSEDQRSSPCWYLKKLDDEKYFLGHYPESQKFEGINFSDKFEACAAFVKRYVEQVRMY